MTGYAGDDWSHATDRGARELNDQSVPAELDELPPVQPPSAAFIIQLFVVPLLIVGAVIGVYVLFGKMASGQQDWRQQIVDFRSDNPHIRWRGALGLAQMLEANQKLDDGTHLTDNPEVAAELTQMLSDLLSRSNPDEEQVKQQEFLARTLAHLNVNHVVLPTLQTAIGPGRDREVRKNALASIALIAERTQEHQAPWDDSSVVTAVIDASRDSDSLVRHTATFTLGLLPSEAARSQLELLTESDDLLCRVNAAVGLARSGSLQGLPVFEEVLTHALADARSPMSEEQTIEHMLILSNTVRALSGLRGALTLPARERFCSLLEPIATSHPDSRVRIDAAAVLEELQG